MNLIQKHCVPCEGGTPPMSKDKVEKYRQEVPDWEVAPDYKKITKEFRFNDFREAMAFISKVADVAEAEGHHPDIHIFYNRVKMELWTHAVKGLSENDFILAAKINALTAKGP